MLSANAFARAGRFVHERARPIDVASFDLHFAAASPTQLTAALATYQNEDGGFGHGIEPDFRLPRSSVMATVTAFKYLMNTAVSSETELVQRGIAYLLTQYSSQTESWCGVPPAVDEYPRAPWWDHACWHERQGAAWLNPNAEVLGILLHYRDHVPAAFLPPLLDKARRTVQSAPAAMAMHDFLAACTLAEAATGEMKTELYGELEKRIPQTVAFDAESWQHYGFKPSWAAPDDGSPFIEALGESLEESLLFEIARQEDEGCWSPNWQWGQFEEDWQQARTEWQGFLTVKTVKTLIAHDKLERD